MKQMSKKMQGFLDVGIMAIIRIDSKKDINPTIDAMLWGGINHIEISLVTPNAIDAIADIHDEYGNDIMIGAGTVLDTPSARLAILAGADFIVSPTVCPEVITMTKRYGRLCFSGGFTPTEVLLAWETGSDAVKLFPAMPTGPSYLKAVNAPMKQIPLVAVGGVTTDNLAEWFIAGAVGVASASNLADPKLIKNGEFDKIKASASEWVRIAKEAREIS